MRKITNSGSLTTLIISVLCLAFFAQACSPKVGVEKNRKNGIFPDSPVISAEFDIGTVNCKVRVKPVETLIIYVAGPATGMPMAGYLIVTGINIVRTTVNNSPERFNNTKVKNSIKTEVKNLITELVKERYCSSWRCKISLFLAERFQSKTPSIEDIPGDIPDRLARLLRVEGGKYVVKQEGDREKDFKCDGELPRWFGRHATWHIRAVAERFRADRLQMRYKTHEC